MAGSVNKVIDAYRSGMTLQEVSDANDMPVSTARYHIKKAGALRSQSEALRMSLKRKAHSDRMRGQKRGPWPDEVKEKMSKAATERWAGKAAGVSQKTNGYVEYTTGPHKGRSVHVVAMEERIGRRLGRDECVHHIDRNKHNNDMSNLALVTRSGHMRIHRFEDQLAGKERERNEDGRFS